MSHTNGTKQTTQEIPALPLDGKRAPEVSELNQALQKLRMTERLLLTFATIVTLSVETLMRNSWVRADGDALQTLESLKELARKVREHVEKRNGH